MKKKLYVCAGETPGGVEVEVCDRCYALVATSDLTFHGKFFHDDIDDLRALGERVTALEEK